MDDVVKQAYRLEAKKQEWKLKFPIVESDFKKKTGDKKWMWDTEEEVLRAVRTMLALYPALIAELDQFPLLGDFCWIWCFW